jgi:hypothetical protein
MRSSFGVEQTVGSLSGVGSESIVGKNPRSEVEPTRCKGDTRSHPQVRQSGVDLRMSEPDCG